MRTIPSANGYSTVFAEVAAMEVEAATFKDEIKILVMRQITVEGVDMLIKHQNLYLILLKMQPCEVT